MLTNEKKEKKGRKPIMNTNTQSFISKLQITAIILLTAGWGWAGGNFSAGLPLWNMLLHCIPILLLLVMSLQIFRVRGAQQGVESNARGARIGMSIFAIVSIIGAIVLVVLGATNPDPNSVGVHNLWDWFPTIIIIGSSLLWLTTLISVRRGNAAVTTANNQ